METDKSVASIYNTVSNRFQCTGGVDSSGSTLILILKMIHVHVY